MSTGPEHYAEAERLLSVALGNQWGNTRAQLIATAQVHATLALTAVTALANAPTFASVAHTEAWTAVAS